MAEQVVDVTDFLDGGRSVAQPCIRLVAEGVHGHVFAVKSDPLPVVGEPAGHARPAPAVLALRFEVREQRIVGLRRDDGDVLQEADADDERVQRHGNQKGNFLLHRLYCE